MGCPHAARCPELLPVGLCLHVFLYVCVHVCAGMCLHVCVRVCAHVFSLWGILPLP